MKMYCQEQFQLETFQRDFKNISKRTFLFHRELLQYLQFFVNLYMSCRYKNKELQRKYSIIELH